MSRSASGRDGGGHRLDAEDVEGAAQIVGERRQAELGAHIGEAAHQEGALVHPLLDAAEGMLDDLAATVEKSPASSAGRIGTARRHAGSSRQATQGDRGGGPPPNPPRVLCRPFPAPAQREGTGGMMRYENRPAPLPTKGGGLQRRSAAAFSRNSSTWRCSSATVRPSPCSSLSTAKLPASAQSPCDSSRHCG